MSKKKEEKIHFHFDIFFRLAFFVELLSFEMFSCEWHFKMWEFHNFFFRSTCHVYEMTELPICHRWIAVAWSIRICFFCHRQIKCIWIRLSYYYQFSITLFTYDCYADHNPNGNIHSIFYSKLQITTLLLINFEVIFGI